MKSTLLPLLALPFLLGACNVSTSKSAYIDTNPAVSAGTKDTKWGELPSYEPAGHRFIGISAPKFGKPTAAGTTKLDLLVDLDGTVRDVAIIESSGDGALDKSFAAAFKKARYSLKLNPTDPAPYVVRYSMTLANPVRTASNRDRQGFVDGRSLRSAGPQPDFSSAPSDPWAAR